LAYNLKEKDDSKPPDYFSEFDSTETINAIITALSKMGHRVATVDVGKTDIFDFFRRRHIDVVFNIAEGHSGRFRESQIPAVLDYLGIPYTGSNTFSLALALNKAFTKKILLAENIPTPRFQLFSGGSEVREVNLNFPLIVKPNCEGSAKGIDRSCVVYDEKALCQKVEELSLRYRQEVLVEEFIEGRELTVGILENGVTTVLPILEIDFSTCAKSGEFFYSWRVKEYQGNAELGLVPIFHCPAPLDRDTEELVKSVALRTHRAIGCFDISRVDIRLSKDNLPYVLEINPLPGLNPRESNFPIMAYAAGLKYEDIIDSILMNAIKRRKGRIEQ